MAISNSPFISNSRAFRWAHGNPEQKQNPSPSWWTPDNCQSAPKGGDSSFFSHLPIAGRGSEGTPWALGRHRSHYGWLRKDQAPVRPLSWKEHFSVVKEPAPLSLWHCHLSPYNQTYVLTMSPDIPPPSLFLKTSTLSSFVIQISFFPHPLLKAVVHFLLTVANSQIETVSYTKVITYQAQDLGSHIVSNFKKWVTRQLRVV